MFSTAINKKRFNKANLYFVGSFVVLVIATTVLLLMLQQQGSTNLKAQLLISNAGNYRAEIEKQQSQLLSLTGIEPQLLNLYADPIKLTDLTRYFDSIAKTISADGSPFDFTSITYGDYTDSSYIPTTLTFTSNDKSLVKFLKLIEQSGISDKETTYLMELSTINVTVNSNEDSGVYTINMVLKVYNFYE